MKKFIGYTFASMMVLLPLSTWAADKLKDDPAKVQEQMKAMQSQMQAMQAQMQQIMSAKTPEDRQKLMQDHMKTMQDHMQSMQGMCDCMGCCKGGMMHDNMQGGHMGGGMGMHDSMH